MKPAGNRLVEPGSATTALPAPFLSLDEVAQMIGCTRRFLETRIADGELKVFRPSARMVRIRRNELERWIEDYSSQGAA